ncbi:MAG TPA: type II toxin-antitoxin system prevent-host-death family antitoxin [Methylomirabilota bacterium]|jgi:prevent-host-death family protein|nr:type II toxin-antitoxin system prevent-host-death family antitoxin [Methylomirabilota bacterium]
MKRYTAAAARQQFSHVLDEAERGEAVIIERRGVRFRVQTEDPAMPKHAPAPVIEFIDPAVAAGQWTWRWGPKGLRFVATKRGRR